MSNFESYKRWVEETAKRLVLVRVDFRPTLAKTSVRFESLTLVKSATRDGEYEAARLSFEDEFNKGQKLSMVVDTVHVNKVVHDFVVRWGSLESRWPCEEVIFVRNWYEDDERQYARIPLTNPTALYQLGRIIGHFERACDYEGCPRAMSVLLERLQSMAMMRREELDRVLGLGVLL